VSDGLRVQYLPVNQAWMVLWHDTRLFGPAPRAECDEYVRRLRESPSGAGEG
jgi:hypothetical protein